MAYTALYRKMRPQTFSGLCGQEHIVKTLKNQLISGRVSHAYLFCGTRGTGKTSTAKIFAKAINCTNLQNGEPCNHCEMCEAIDQNRSFNIFEIDAASNNGVDNIRELREEVNYPPAVGKYKVYIIDEVHMLSLAAFNALLKTLEEPPEHIVFILATTDPQKVPVTILSRCQRFDFKRIPAATVAEALSDYMAKENVSITKEAINVISGVCDGAMRDALSILDRCISFYYGEEITRDKVLEVIGSADKSVFFEMTNAVCTFNTEAALEITDRVFNEGRDLNRFISEFIVHLRNVLLAKNANHGSIALDYSEENIKRLMEQGSALESDRLIELISAFSSFLNDIKYADNIKVRLEVFLIKLTKPRADGDSSLLARVEQLERLAEENLLNTALPAERPAANTVNAEKNEEAADARIIEKAVPEDIENVIKNFDSFRNSFKESGRKTFMRNIKPGYLQGDKLYFVCPHTALYDYCLRNMEELKGRLTEVFDREFNVQPILEEDYDRRHKAIYGEKDGERGGESAVEEKDISNLADKIVFNNIEIH